MRVKYKKIIFIVKYFPDCSILNFIQNISKIDIKKKLFKLDVTLLNSLSVDVTFDRSFRNLSNYAVVIISRDIKRIHVKFYGGRFTRYGLIYTDDNCLTLFIWRKVVNMDIHFDEQTSSYYDVHK